ncbi:hypothetical protein [Streptomyces albus]|uniref:hypothetical protein n=1 Tax=Streptomyces albus TaxID=1888 RepID=UPI0006896AF7|nr:hypothetical protein [Streptomyces albus]
MTSDRRATGATLLPLTLAAVTAVTAVAVLTGCGTKRPAGEDGGPPTAAGAPATAGSPGSAGSAGASVPPRAQLEERARRMGSAIELIYVAEVPGFRRAQQSAGVYGGDGFSAMYVAASGGGTVQLSVGRGTLRDREECERTPLSFADGGGGGGKVACERDGDAWYRTSGDAHEYARPEDGHVVRLTADRESADRGILRSGARDVRPADDAELHALLPPLPDRGGTGGEGTGGAGGGGQQPERGDLPPEGDGAPNNNVDVGG